MNDQHRLSTQEIERAKGVDLIALVGSRIKLTRRGRVFWGLCPFHVDKNPSFKVEREFYKCFGCGAGGDAIKWLQQMEGLSFPDAVRTLARAAGDDVHAQVHTVAPPPVDPPTDKRQADKANWLWRQRMPIHDSPAEFYLRCCRGYSGSLPATLGFLAPSKPEHHPAMIAAFGIAQEPEPGVLAIHDADVRAIHLTLLRPDGSGKADVEKPKIMVGTVKGSPIIIAPPNDLLGLAISEGAEDGLSLHAAMGFGVWAAGSASFMPALADMVPDYIESISIYAHADMAGQDGARNLAARLRERGWDETRKTLFIIEFGASP